MSAHFLVDPLRHVHERIAVAEGILLLVERELGGLSNCVAPSVLRIRGARTDVTRVITELRDLLDLIRPTLALPAGGGDA